MRPSKGRRCEICGGGRGAITCYRTAMHLMGVKKSYAHTKCFQSLRDEQAKREAPAEPPTVTPEMVKSAVGKFGADIPWCRMVANRINEKLAAQPPAPSGEQVTIMEGSWSWPPIDIAAPAGRETQLRAWADEGLQSRINAVIDESQEAADKPQPPAGARRTLAEKAQDDMSDFDREYPFGAAPHEPGEKP